MFFYGARRGTHARLGPVYIDFENQQREDFSAYAVPDDCIGFVMGRSGQTLRTYEDEWGARPRRPRR